MSTTETPPTEAAAPTSAGAPTAGERMRLLPRSLLGLAVLLFFMSLAAGFSGSVLFAYYRFELEDTRDRVAEVENNIVDDLESARQILETDRTAATDEIQALLEELSKFAASGSTMSELLADASPSVYFVETLDVGGQPSVGSAFVLFSDSERSFFLTSYSTIAAATFDPGPSIRVSKDGNEIPARLKNWDQQRDLALIEADVPNIPPLPRADLSSVAVGDRVFAVSGLGAGGGAITQGVVADTSGTAVRHEAPIGPEFRGGPLLNSRGELIGISSRDYSPVGFRPDTVFFSPPWREACAQVVQCPDNI